MAWIFHAKRTCLFNPPAARREAGTGHSRTADAGIRVLARGLRMGLPWAHPMKRFTAVTCAAMAALALGPARAEFQIRNNDRVVFLGDSITEQRLYTTYVEAYAITRHPGWRLRFRNVGWGGDTSGFGNARIRTRASCSARRARTSPIGSRTRWPRASGATCSRSSPRSSR